MHLDELDQLRAVVVGHPVARLDLPAGLDIIDKFLFLSGHRASYPNDR